MPQISLDDLRNESSLSSYIQDLSWSRDFSKATLGRADLYARDNAVLTPSITQSAGVITIQAQVKGSGRNRYTSTIRLSPSGTSWDGYSSCSCPVYSDCKHVAAVFYTLADFLDLPAATPVTPPSDIEAWLSEIATTTNPHSAKPKARKTARRTHALAYLLDPQEDNVIHLLMGKIAYGKDGRISVDNTDLTPNIKRKSPAYFQDGDYELAFHAMYKLPDSELSDGWRTYKKITASHHDFLNQLLATGRLFFRHQFTPRAEISALVEGPSLPISPSWEATSDGLYRPTLGETTTGKSFYDLGSIIYLDLENHLLGQAKTPDNLPPHLLNIWQKGPTVPAEKAGALCQKMEALGIPVTIPRPLALPEEILPEVTPVIHLSLLREKAVTHLSQQSFGGTARVTTPPQIIAQIQFDYHGHRLPATADKDPSSRISSEEAVHIIPRDLDAEKSAFSTVRDLSLAPLSYIFLPEEISPEHTHSLGPDLPLDEWDSFWIHFISFDVAALEDMGWHVHITESADLTIIHSDDIFTDLVEDEDRGIDWFRFDTGIVTTEGQRLSLLDLVAGFLKSSRTIPAEEEIGEDERIIVPDPLTQTYFNLPAKRFFTILRSIRDLFDRPDDGLHRLEAAELADTLALDESKTLADLRALGQQLKKKEPHQLVPQPQTITADLRDYQSDGFQWLQFLARHHLHGILADDMGLGKTLQTLTHIAAEVANKRTDGNPILVVAPTSVVPNWAAEAAKFCPKLKVLTLHGSDRQTNFKKIDKSHIVITSYALLHRDEKEHLTHSYHLAILDEAQYIKNPKAKVAQTACKLDARHRLCLSGTPLENHLGELWSLSRFLMPGLLGTESTFNKHFKNPIERHADTTAQHALNSRISPLILRRTKAQVVLELPAKTEIIHRIPLNKPQQDLYESVRVAMDSKVRDAIADKGLARSQILVLDALLKLRQICCHPQLIKTAIAKKAQNSAKLDFLTELLTTLIEEDRRILLFSQFTTMLSMIESHLIAEGIPFVKITGATKDRKTPVETFQKGEIPVFLISLKAGGTGLNLTAADTVIHYDPWWNPSAENQATDRAHRIGQKNPVFVHKLISEGTIEERILELQARKSRLVEALLSAKTSKLSLDTETLNTLLSPITSPS